ncbi:MAG: hypothetical protein K2L48_00575 [Mycoplasmoidaceae bacterium]|nr:hypothetical protein [Mycoplasmoidaceae bacterium]
MNKKLIKTITCLTCGLGCASAVFAATSSFSLSKRKPPFILKSTYVTLNKDPNFDIDYSSILGSYKALPEESFKFGGYKNQNLIGFVDGFDLASYIAKGYDTLIIPSLPSGGIVENTFSDGLKGIKNIAIR